MAFSMDNGGAHRGRRRASGLLSEINIIPLVDVVLVLLIIFMLTAQAMEYGLEVEVPKVMEQESSIDDMPVVTVTRAGEIYLAEKPVNINLLADEIRKQYPKQSAGAYVKADKTTTYERLAQVINALSQAKIAVRLVMKPADEVRPRARR
ncbi:MAG: biopolymer transporter ExbD [Acidobacteria bacterium]|nr:biopolymer transporter ExbD [Acidobacteriota bacterium]